MYNLQVLTAVKLYSDSFNFWHENISCKKDILPKKQVMRRPS